MLKKHGEKTDNPSIRIYVNKIKNRITSRIKTSCIIGRLYSRYFEFLRPETMKLFGSIKSKITKVRSGKNVSDLEIAEVVLVHCNIINNDYQQDSRVLYTFAPSKSFGQL